MSRKRSTKAGEESGMDRAEAQNRRDQDEESPSGMGMDEHINTYSTEL